ncbi:uncharacterized protein [Lepeophtheirus salmonis]|nr:uncharacterized protein LOC121122556 isoform X2 [Lepeophtheirus salmonis]XP_040573516.1 uncharacterized protein LOC121122556 isoform X2 [Lepeophtheirus salmonis]
MSYYEPHHTCSYNIMTLDELRLNSLRRRSEGIRNVDKAFDIAQIKIQEQVEHRNSSLEARLLQLNELQSKVEDDTKRITGFKAKPREDLGFSQKISTDKARFKSEKPKEALKINGEKRIKKNIVEESKTFKEDKPKEPEVLKPKEPEDINSKKPEVVRPKEPEIVKATEPEVVKPKESKEDLPKEPEVVKPKEPKEDLPKEPEVIKPMEPEVIKPMEPEVIKPKKPEVIQPKEPEVVKEKELELIEPKQKNQNIEQSEGSKTTHNVETGLKSSESTQEQKIEEPVTEERKKAPELIVIPVENDEEGKPDKINQILECNDVLDPTSKSMSPFEQNLVAFGQHFNFIPSPEPEKWESSESEEEIQEEPEEVVEEELTPYKAALKKKYDEEVCTTKTASWGGDKPKGRYDMSFLNVNQGEEIIHGNLFTQFKEWITAVKEEEIGDNALKSIKSHQNDPVVEGAPKIDPHPAFKNRSDYIYIGEKNVMAKPHGDGELTFHNGDRFKGEFLNGERHGYGALNVSPDDKLFHTVSSIEGTYVHDQLEGEAKIVHKNGDIRHAFCSKGSLHGICKLFDKDYNIIEMGWYLSGEKEGQFWRFLTGGSYLVGGVTETKKIGGDDVIYIYPDLKTCFKGTFVDEQMLLGQACYVEVAMKKRDIFYIKTTTPKGPKYKYDPSTRDRMCELDPLLPDPYEYNCIYIKQSRMKGAGDGIFALKDLYRGEVVSFYNGIPMKSDELNAKSDEWEKNAYKIMNLLGKDQDGKEGVIDIPEEYIALDKYKASLSHKANHSFEPNAKFTLFHHARFGLIPSLVITAEAVAHDKEITVSYDYAMDESPPWYQDLYTQNMMTLYQESKNFEG